MKNQDAPKKLVFLAALLFLVGNLTGLLVAAAETGAIAADGGAMLASHLNALLGTFMLLGVAWSLRFVELGDKALKIMLGCFVVSAYANWIVTAVKAFLKVRGLEFTGQGANDGIALALTSAVVLPTLVGAVLWAWGSRGRAPATA